MRFPIYSNTKYPYYSYWYEGVLYNSVLLLCILFTLICMLTMYYLIYLIRGVWGYINKIKPN